MNGGTANEARYVRVGSGFFHRTEKPDKTRFSEENEAYKTEKPDFLWKMGNLISKIWFFVAFGTRFSLNSLSASPLQVWIPHGGICSKWAAWKENNHGLPRS